MNEYMRLAINEAREGMRLRHGGPFGAIIVKDGKVLSSAHNEVLLSNDPTMHGEINAIRKATSILKSHDLSGCEIYTTGEPCPMCLSACMWANISKIYYGCSIEENERIGFRDNIFDKAFGGRSSELTDNYLEVCDNKACLELFEEYERLDNKSSY